MLVVLFWWMLIYQIVVFKNRGLEGYTPDDEVEPMYRGRADASSRPSSPGWKSSDRAAWSMV